jgi:hypothetical protein
VLLLLLLLLLLYLWLLYLLYLWLLYLLYLWLLGSIAGITDQDAIAFVAAVGATISIAHSLIFSIGRP